MEVDAAAPFLREALSIAGGSDRVRMKPDHDQKSQTPHGSRKALQDFLHVSLTAVPEPTDFCGSRT